MRESTAELTTRDGVHLHVTTYESDPGKSAADSPWRDVLLLHGWPNAGRVWRQFADAMLLADPSYRLYALDQRGYGASARPAARSYSCEAMARDAADVAWQLGLTTSAYTLMGHSMSGKIAQVAAAHHPEGLERLVLLTPTPTLTTPLSDETKSALSGGHGNAERIRQFIAGLPAHPLPDEQMDLLVEDGLRVSRGAWDGWVKVMRDEDFAYVCEKITVPTLVVAGGKDSRVKPDVVHDDVAGCIQDARFTVLPGSGHLPHVEEPNALAAVVANFLDDSLPPENAA